MPSGCTTYVPIPENGVVIIPEHDRGRYRARVTVNNQVNPRESEEVIKLWDAICAEIKTRFHRHMLHEEAKDRFIGDDPDIIFDCEENTAHGVKPACRALKDALREADERYDDQIFIQDGYTTFIGIDDYHARSFVRHLESGSIRLELMRDL